MMIKRSIGLLFMVLTVALSVNAQSTSALRINEVLTNNENNYVDAFGNRGAWIEIYNNSAGTVQLAGCFLTTDKSQPKMYMISKGDVRTKLAPRQHVIIWADALPHRGTFHANFKLNKGGENYIALYDASGKKLIDEVTVPALKADQSFGVKVEGDETLELLQYPTPDAANHVENSNPKIEKFEVQDPYGFGMAMIAMTVVFLALIILYIAFKQIGRLALILSAKRQVKSGSATDLASAKADVSVRGAALAAIAMALDEYQGADHDSEETVLTIKQIKRNYSPWSSKIYGLRENPRRK